MKWLKAILENDEIEDKLDAISKEIPLKFIPKDKFNEVSDKLKEKEAELDANKAEMEKLSGQVKNLAASEEEKEALKAQIDKLNADFETVKSDADARVINIKKRQAVERGLRDANANPDTIDLLIDKFDLTAIELDDKDAVKEWDKHLAPIKEQRKSLFGETSITGDPPQDGDPPNPNTYRTRYDAAVKAGDSLTAIKIKQEAFEKGEKF
jgi:DNA repair exonuclease SbcCD ATPase subunit